MRFEIFISNFIKLLNIILDKEVVIYYNERVLAKKFEINTI